MKRLLIFCFLLLSTPALARSTVLSLTVDHGTSVTLSGPATSVFVANPDIADVQVMSPTQVMIFGKRTGETSFMASDSKGVTLAERTLIVTQDLSELRAELNAAIPGNAIKATAVPNGIVLTGTAADPISVADSYKIAMRYLPSGGDIINRVQVTGSNQIQIRVRFAEVQRNIDNSLGFDWQSLFTMGSGFVVGLANGSTVNSGLSSLSSGSSSTGLFPRPNNSTLSAPNDVLGASVTANHLSLNGMIDALAQDGLVTILAEPNLTAMSGETANFLAGGEFPIPIPQGNGTISITFKDYGISLAFTPTLLAGDRISLHVRPEVSELSNTGSIVLSNITVPALTTRKAETTVEVASGESFAIAGLMDNSQSQTVDKFPLLGDMPVLGALFRSSAFQNGQTELVVIITPYIVKPSTQRLALPTDGLTPPTEKDRLLDMRYSGSDPAARPMSGDPVAVPAAPAAAPIAPVSTIGEPDQGASVAATSAVTYGSQSIPQSPPVPKTSSSVPPKSDSAATRDNSAAEAKTVPAPQTQPALLTPVAVTMPLVMHSSGDTDKSSGGLLVE